MKKIIEYQFNDKGLVPARGVLDLPDWKNQVVIKKFVSFQLNKLREHKKEGLSLFMLPQVKIITKIDKNIISFWGEEHG